MAEERIICVGTGNPLTTPKSARRENSRGYRYAPPGKLHRWEGIATTFEESALPDSPLVSACGGGPPILGWGLIVLGDTYTKELKPIVEMGGHQQPPEWETVIIKARDRCLDLLAMWANPFPRWDFG